jgi:hypothetical protein
MAQLNVRKIYFSFFLGNPQFCLIFLLASTLNFLLLFLSNTDLTVYVL